MCCKYIPFLTVQALEAEDSDSENAQVSIIAKPLDMIVMLMYWAPYYYYYNKLINLTSKASSVKKH